MATNQGQSGAFFFAALGYFGTFSARSCWSPMDQGRSRGSRNVENVRTLVTVLTALVVGGLFFGSFYLYSRLASSPPVSVTTGLDSKVHSPQ
jgi:hypothetical protein